MKVFVAVDGEEGLVLGAYSTKEKAQAAADEWAAGSVERQGWHLHDGSWCRYVGWGGDDWLALRVTECEVDA